MRAGRRVEERKGVEQRKSSIKSIKFFKKLFLNDLCFVLPVSSQTHTSEKLRQCGTLYMCAQTYVHRERPNANKGVWQCYYLESTNNSELY